MFGIKQFIVICTGLLICTACASSYPVEPTLLHAHRTVDSNPEEALEILEEIPDPEKLDQDNYMRYIVLRTQARYMNDLDITDDKEILEAQRYFAGKEDPEMAARASFYTAAYYREKNENDIQLEYQLLTNYYATLAGDPLFRSKSLHWIGSIYYNQDVLDSALVYYHQALELYNTDVKDDANRMDLIFMLGRTYREMHQFDDAINYFNEGLNAAQKLNNIKNEINFIVYKNIVYREKKDFEQSKKYLDIALSKKPDTQIQCGYIYNMHDYTGQLNNRILLYIIWNWLKIEYLKLNMHLPAEIFTMNYLFITNIMVEARKISKIIYNYITKKKVKLKKKKIRRNFRKPINGLKHIKNSNYINITGLY